MKKLFLFAAPIAALACFACFVSPPSSSTSSTTTGQALATSLACASCHGSDFSGSESPIAPGVYAANLTPDIATGLGSWSDDDITRAIRTGQDDQDSALCAKMPRFSTLADDQASALVAYLRSLPAIAHDIPESECDAPPDLDDGGPGDGGVDIVTDDAPSCEGFADPNTTATCHACSSGQASCQHNGCFGGYFCDLAALHCVPKPSGC